MNASAAHTSARRYKCSVCSEGFLRNDVRRRHEQRRQCRGSTQETESDNLVPRKRHHSEIEAVDDEQRHNSLYPNVWSMHGDHVPNFSHKIGNPYQSKYQETPPTDTPSQVEASLVSIAERDESDWVSFEETFRGLYAWHEMEDVRAAIRPEEMEDVRDTADERTITPELSRGSSIENSDSSIDLSAPNDSIPGMAVTTNDSDLISRFRDQFDKTGPLPTGLVKGKLNRSANKCTICSRPYEKDTIELQEHLNQHLQDLQRKFLCDPCELGSVHRADLLSHQRSAAGGHCGFPFEHSMPCTGTILLSV